MCDPWTKEALATTVEAGAIPLICPADSGGWPVRQNLACLACRENSSSGGRQTPNSPATRRFRWIIMGMATPQWAKGIWHDPVWSKVIAAGIILVIGSIAGWLSFHYRNGLLTRAVPLWSLLLATFLLICLALSLAFTLCRREFDERGGRTVLEPITWHSEYGAVRLRRDSSAMRYCRRC
jgi:hypothetical protein